MTDYQPIDCDLHSKYELFAMHRESVELKALDEDKRVLTFKAQVVDVLTRNKAEYLVLKMANGEETRIRLDKIIELVSVD